MGSNALIVAVDLYPLIGVDEFNELAYVAVRNRVVVFVG